MSNIYLIGMPGSGKNLLASKVSTMVNMDTIDLNLVIENFKYKTIGEILATEGEESLRTVEAMILQGLNFTDNIIVTLGEGVTFTSSNVEYMKKTGLIVFVDRDVERIVEDNKFSNEKRYNDKEMYDLYFNYAGLFSEVADEVVDNNTSIDESASQLAEIIKREVLNGESFIN